MPAQHGTPYWLKSIGSTSFPMVEDYLREPWGKGRLDILDHMRFSKNKRPSGMSAGHKMVLYAAGHERIFGIATVTTGEIYEQGEDTEERWPWALDVQVPMLVSDLRIAPHLSAINVAPLSVRQQSYISLTAEQYALAIDAFCSAVRV